MADFFYKKKKVIPDESVLQQYLTPLAIAYWFMDDGSLKSHGRAFYLCTDSFTLKEQKVMKNFLREKYS